MAPRADLHTLLLTIVDHVYFQPPASLSLSYPCIQYVRSDIDSEFANNNPYKLVNRYTLTVIDANPDSLIPEKVASLPTSVMDRHFVTDNLNHDVFELYF